jgi:hypothetical protein
MTTNTKKILIETESREIFIVRRNGKEIIRGSCRSCAVEAEMLDLNTAVSFSGLGARELIRQIEGGGIHSLEIESGHLLICKTSLVSFVRAKEGEKR